MTSLCQSSPKNKEAKQFASFFLEKPPHFGEKSILDAT
ncbi:hypothetical protein HPS12939_0923 [Glaesserella parasuis 12939]|nr:hypothetical protein HPS12939_0923 [Glaesserella parasuis 12939]